MSDYITKIDNQAINQELAQSVSEDTILLANGKIKEEINKLRNQKEQLEKLVKDYEAKKLIKQEKNELSGQLKEAYASIMSVRNNLLGKSAEIQYQIYYHAKNNNAGESDLSSVVVYNLTEEQLLNLVYREGTTLRLTGKISQKKLSQLEQNIKANNLIQNHFDKISSSFRHPTRAKSLYIVGEDIVSEYGKKGQSYTWQPGEATKTRGKSPYTFKLFNRGWIYQAFAATVESFGNQVDKISDSEFRRKYFTEELKYDNVKGFKGGDVGLTQIKSNAANLISATTLINYLSEIIILFESILGQENKQNVIEKIKDLFLNGTENFTQEIDLHLDSTVDNLLNIIKIK